MERSLVFGWNKKGNDMIFQDPILSSACPILQPFKKHHSNFFICSVLNRSDRMKRNGVHRGEMLAKER